MAAFVADAQEELQKEPLAASSEPGDYANKAGFLDDRLKYFINDYRKKRNHSRNSAAAFKVVTIVIGASLTLLLGVKSNPLLIPAAENYLSVVALVLSTCLTAMSVWEAFADYRWKWIRYRATLSTLYTLRDDFKYQKSGNSLSPKIIDNLYDQLKRTVHETNEEWMSQRGNALSGGAGKKE